MTTPAVTVHVASLDTREATELCIRSLRRNAGLAHRLVVGDGGSTDGSLEMLRDFAAAGWLELEEDPSRPRHHEWLDRWLARAMADGSGYVVFADSDIDFRRDGALARLVERARERDAALVASEMVAEKRDYIEPVAGERIRLGERFAAWLFLVDPAQVRSLGTSFAFVKEETDRVPEGTYALDTGGAFLRAAREAGLRVEVMPPSYRRSYEHFAGLSWRGTPPSDEPWRRRLARRRLRRRLAKLRREDERA